jgi:hypothetical protein
MHSRLEQIVGIFLETYKKVSRLLENGPVVSHLEADANDPLDDPLVRPHENICQFILAGLTSFLQLPPVIIEPLEAGYAKLKAGPVTYNIIQNIYTKYNIDTLDQ